MKLFPATFVPASIAGLRLRLGSAGDLFFCGRGDTDGAAVELEGAQLGCHFLCIRFTYVEQCVALEGVDPAHFHFSEYASADDSEEFLR